MIVSEASIERRLKYYLEGYGFKVIKLTTPGYAGVPDRMILMPTWAPGPPVFAELKRPGKSERALQEALRCDWEARGVDVRKVCDTIAKASMLGQRLLWEAEQRNPTERLPFHRFLTEPPAC